MGSPPRQAPLCGHCHQSPTPELYETFVARRYDLARRRIGEDSPCVKHRGHREVRVSLRHIETRKSQLRVAVFLEAQIARRLYSARRAEHRANSCSVDHGRRVRHVESAYDIRTVQEILGHRDVRTTMIYTHVLNRGPAAVRSPADLLVSGTPRGLLSEPGSSLARYPAERRSLTPRRLRDD
jgi:hypothetical protein